MRSSCSRTITPEMVCDALTTDEQVELLGRHRDGRRRSGRPGLDELRVPPLEVAHLAVGAPAEVAVAGLAQVGVGDQREPAPPVEARGRLVGDRLVVDEAVVARRANRLLVQARGVFAIAAKPRELGRQQARRGSRSSRGSSAPRSAAAGGARRAPAGARRRSLGRRGVVRRRVREPREEMVLGDLGERPRRPQQGLAPSPRPRGRRRSRARRSAPAACGSSTSRRRSPGSDRPPGAARTRPSSNSSPSNDEKRAVKPRSIWISLSCAVRTSTTRPNFALRANASASSAVRCTSRERIAGREQERDRGRCACRTRSGGRRSAGPPRRRAAAARCCCARAWSSAVDHLREAEVDARLEAQRPALLHQIEAQLAEAERRSVVVEVRSQHLAEQHVGLGRTVAVAVLEAEVDGARDDEAAAGSRR